MAGKLKALAVSVFIGLFGLMALPAAQAQLPGVPGVPVPGLPALPPAATDAISDAQDMIIPVMIQLASAAEPVPNAAGFALRGPCSATGTVVVLLVIGGGAVPLPISPGLAVTPIFLMCGAAFDAGPADPHLDTVDATVGPQFSDATEPVMDQVGGAIAPARPNIAQACAVIALAGSTPEELPPPLHRLNVVKTLCAG
jgi:hypothetical protein